MKHKLLGIFLGSILSFGAIVGISSKDFVCSNAESKHYNLITSLNDGDQVAIGEQGSLVTAGTYQAGEYFAADHAYIVNNSFDGEPQTFTVCIVSQGIYEFKYGNKYLAVNSDSSAISLVDSSTDNSKWIVYFEGNDAVILNAGQTNRYLKYNIASPRFAAYKVNSDRTANPQFYKVGETKILDSISASGDYKTTYYEGEKFEEDKLIVTAIYTDGTSSRVNNYTLAPNDNLEASDTKITVSYTLGQVTKTTDINITVNENPVTELKIENYTTNFYLGYPCVFDGVCTAIFKNGETKIVDNPTVDTSKVNINVPGTYEVAVSYKEGSASYDVNYSFNTKEKYTLVTSETELEDDMEFLLGVPSSNIASDIFKEDYISKIDAEFISNDLFLKSSNPMKLKSNGNCWNIYFGEKKLGAAKSKELLLNGKNAVNDWFINFDLDGNVLIENHNDEFGKLFYNNSSHFFKNYTSTTMSKIKMYKFEDTSLKAKFDIDSFEGNINETQTVNILCDGFEPDSILWSSLDEDVAAVDDSITTTTTITITGEGETTVKAEISYLGITILTLELPVVGHNYSHDIIADGSKLVVTYETTNDAMNPVDTTNIPKCEFLEDSSWTFEAVGKGDNVYAIKSNNKYLSSKKSDAKGILTNSMEDWFKIEENNGNFTIKSLVNNKFLVHYVNAQNKVFWYFFDSNYSNINQLSLVAPRIFEKLEVSGTPNKLIYNIGEPFDVSPAKIYADYLNGDEEIRVNVTSQLVWDEITSESEFVTGRITLSGQERTISFEITVTNYVLDSISVAPNKIDYFVGESIVEDDVVVTAIYVDQIGGQPSKEEKVNFSDLDINPSRFTSKSQNSVTVTYLGKSDSYNVVVEEPRFQFANSITNGDEVVFVCEDFGVEMDIEEGSFEYDFAPCGISLFLVENGVESGSKSFKLIGEDQYLTLDGTKLSLSSTKDTLSSWTVTINNEEAFLWNVAKTDKLIGFNSDSMKFTTSPNYPYAIQIYKDVTINIPESISIQTQANKREFEIGEEFTYEGLTLKVNYGGGAFDIVSSGFEVVAPDMTTSGTKTVTINYHGKTTTYAITVKKSQGEVVPVGLSVNGMKTVFTAGEHFTFDGTVKLLFSDETNRTLNSNEYTVYGLDDAAMREVGQRDIKVEYDADTTIFTTYRITIKKAPPTVNSLELSNIKTKYFYGENLVKPTVTAKFSDGTSEVVTNDATFTGFSSSTAGEKTVTVSYGNKTTTFNVDILTLQKISLSNIKEKYEIGEQFVNPTVVATYTTSDARVISQGLYTVSGFDSSKAGKQTVTIIYSEGSITVSETFTVQIGNPAAPNGCAGDIITTSVILSTLSIIGIAVILIRKKRIHN